ncbi:MAG: magnesium transporter [Oscillospiraceae bacterium]|nr:magnesium transporter [Oscillospiraceae bacterium]
MNPLADIEEWKDGLSAAAEDAPNFETQHEQRIEEMSRLLEEKQMKRLQSVLEETEEFEVAEFLMALPPHQMAIVFRMLSKEQGAAVFAELDAQEQKYIINTITDSELGSILDELYLDDTVDMMEELPANVVKRVMRIATPQTRALINQYLKYPENSAGSIMTAEFIDLKKYMTVKESFARIRRLAADMETIYTCFVTSGDRKLEGTVTVKDLIMADESAVIESIMDSSAVFCRTTDDQEDVSGMFSDYDLLALPVVDRENRLVGIVTVDDVMDVMEQEATEDIEAMAAIKPSTRPYLKTGVLSLWRNRIPWLLLLMVSATFTGMIITSFEDALAAQVALTAFIPMLMDTGGNSGSQSSVTIIRGLSLGDLEFSDFLQVIWKEIRVALLCGATLAAATFLKVLLIDRLLLGNDSITILVAATVCLTMLVTVVCAKIVGCSLPMLAEKVGLDPAVMASPFITTIVDAVSLLIYFNIAKALLHI